MSKPSSIDPRGQKGLEYILGITGIRSNPENVDMQTIQPVIDMGMSGYAKLNDYTNLLTCREAGASIAGLQTQTYQILSYGNAVGADQQVVVPVGYNAIMWGMKLYVYFNAAGAAALAGKYISCMIKFVIPDAAATEIVKYSSSFHISAGNLLYAPGHYEMEMLTRNHIYVIPAGVTMFMTWWSQDGTVFPLLTDIVYNMAIQAFPVGSPIPQGV